MIFAENDAPKQLILPTGNVAAQFCSGCDRPARRRRASKLAGSTRTSFVRVLPE